MPRQLGRYQVLFRLARGGMGTVYVGRLIGAHGFDRMMAIKVLSQTVEDEGIRASFFAEARLAARIVHPNVVQTFELGDEDGFPFIVMELIQGVSLIQLLRQLDANGQRITPALAAWIGAHVAEGLHAAHELTDADDRPLALVHRDVSPQNILLSFAGRVCVADFGIAKLAHSDTTQEGVMKGKFAYMSPEQALGETLDRRSDVFSLGTVLYEAISGKQLFHSDAPLRAVRRVLEHSPKSLHREVPGVPESIARVITRCLHKEPSHRYPTARAVADALRDALRREGVAVDESDLRLLLERVCVDKMEQLQRRIASAVRDIDASQESAIDAPLATKAAEVAAGSDDQTVASWTVAPRAVRWGIGLGLLALGIVAVSVWRLREPFVQAADETTPIVSVNAQPEVVATSSASAVASPPPQPASSRLDRWRGHRRDEPRPNRAPP